MADQLDMFADAKPKPKPVRQWVKHPEEWCDVAIEEDPVLLKTVREKLGVVDE